LPAALGVATVFNVEDVNEGEPARAPAEVLEGLEAVRRYAGTDVLDIPRLRYLTQERGRGALAVWVNEHPRDYARGFSTASAQTLVAGEGSEHRS
jgi:hypothetical protein